MTDLEAANRQIRFLLWATSVLIVILLAIIAFVTWAALTDRSLSHNDLDSHLHRIECLITADEPQSLVVCP